MRPFAAFGGWGGGINAKAKDKVKDAAYAFFSYHGAAGAIERRRHHRQDRLQPLPRLAVQGLWRRWNKAGMSETAAKDYLGAIKASLNSPNMILDLRIPQNQKYQQVVLDEADLALPRRRDRRGRGDEGDRRTAGTS